MNGSVLWHGEQSYSRDCESHLADWVEVESKEEAPAASDLHAQNRSLFKT